MEMGGDGGEDSGGGGSYRYPRTQPLDVVVLGKRLKER